jgi:propanol-preferring alcohol dehydrogenase
MDTLKPYAVHAPLTPGHEVARTIAGLGPGITNFKSGEKVAVAQIEYPFAEADWATSVGLGADGWIAEYIVANAHHVVKIPENVPLHTVAVATDTVSTAYHAVATEANAGPGMNIAILGLGGLGLNGVAVAAVKGAVVYGFDIDMKKFEDAHSAVTARVTLASIASVATAAKTLR